MSILESVTNDLAKAAKESAKAKVKKLIEDRQKAADVINGIDDQIVEILVNVGEKEEDVRAAISAGV